MSAVMPSVQSRQEQAVFSSAPPSAVVAPNGRVRDSRLTDIDRHFAVAMHLSPFAGFFFPLFLLTPLGLWLLRKDKSPFVDDHGCEMVNVLINSLLVCVLGGIAGLLTLGLAWLAVVVWHVVIIISQIRGSLAAGRGEYFRYPMVFRFLS